MSPDQTPQQPSFNLPPVAGDAQPPSGGQNTPESVPNPMAAPEVAPPMPLPTSMPIAQPGGLPAPVTQPAAGGGNDAAASGAASTAADDLTADDNDLIEKEWVDRAKAIVAGTRDDPYRQNKELNGFKADYLRKRYNRDIKVD